MKKIQIIALLASLSALAPEARAQGESYAVTINTAANVAKLDTGRQLANQALIARFGLTGSAVTWAAAVATALATTLNVGAMATTNQHMIRCAGTFVPSGSGTFIVRAAQNAHSTGTLTIHRGSSMSVRDSRPL